MKTVLISAILIGVGCYCVVVGLIAWQQRRMLYVPNTNRPDLASLGIANAQPVNVHTGDGLDLLAWFAPPADQTQPVVLYLHGNGGNIGFRGPRLARLSDLGWGVLLLEYRGYGGNPGQPTESGLFEDARAAYVALLQRGIPPSHILLWGESLGTGIAVHLASGMQVGAVLLESPYISIAAVARHHYPFVPVDWLLHDRFELLARIGAVRAPVLVMTGGLDTIVPPAMGQAVFQAANEPKTLWFAPKAGHNDLGAAGACDAVTAFVREHWAAAP